MLSLMPHSGRLWTFDFTASLTSHYQVCKVGTFQPARKALNRAKSNMH